jgi:hypothetical protein
MIEEEGNLLFFLLYMFEAFNPRITKDYILRRVTEEQIFERYLGIKPDYSGLFCNPLREDKSPGCGFYINKQDRIKFKDYSRGWDWDCFNVVEFLFQVSFKEAMQRIAVDFGLTDGTVSETHAARTQRRKDKIGLRVKRREWNAEDKHFWQGNFTLTRADMPVTFPISHAWYTRNDVVDDTPFYTYITGDPAYAYHFPEYGPYEYKIYFPKRPKGKKFRQSRGDIIQGLAQLPATGHILIITKSFKDRHVITKFGKKYGIFSCAPMSESQIIPADIMNNLILRFDYVFTLFDFDRAGIILAKKHQEAYGIRPLFFGPEFKKGLLRVGPQGIKDSADFVKEFGPEVTYKLIDIFYENWINS